MPPRWWGSSGQMTVELAVLVPVILVVALTVLNLMGFVVSCAAFDRACAGAVVTYGVSPSGEGTLARGADEVRSAIAEEVGRDGRCEVEVRAEELGTGDALTSPLLTRYTCTLTYRPWPRRVSLPVVSLEAPLALRHTRELVVDRYRPGVVL